ncbi:MAG: glutamate-1-semialdehyde 2,1-aminomutase [Fibrobacter sp.]|jgi:glutamate-1-semialdehyde 2,1-aminomutase|nr:glutamate-1-semialdehyde 2,1-aminomutase [Fibrobacter sp.]
MDQEKIWEKACAVLPGGVNSPVRAFGGVGGIPVFMKRSEGAFLFDENDKAYIDLVLSWGPMILGHNPPEVVEALKDQLSRGLSFGTCTGAEANLAELILSMIPGMGMLRLVNSGTEATMSAVRAARGYTGRDKIMKFRGCYHGHGDSFLIQAGSGALTHGAPSSLGVTAGTAADTLVADYNDLNAAENLFETYPDSIAAVIVEPVAGNMGVVPPAPGFLEGLRSLCSRFGSVLIFDEVMTGFRVARGGAAERFSVQPDMITLGKIAGGGLPLAAYAGKREIMSVVSPLGKVYQAGTLSGNPMAVAAGTAHLRLLEQKNPWKKLEEKTGYLCSGLRKAAAKHGAPVQVNQVGSMFTLFFTSKPVTDTKTALAADAVAFARFFHAMLEEGIYFPPSQYESAFLSLAHEQKHLDKIIQAAETFFEKGTNV